MSAADGRMAGRESDAVRAAVALLESAAAGLPRIPGDRPEDVSSAEEVCDRLIDLAAARAWLRTAGATAPEGVDDTGEVMHGCVCWVVREDVVRTRSGSASTGGVRDGLPVGAAHALVTRLVTALADPARYDEVCARTRTSLGPRPEGRAAAAWDVADRALRGLGTTRDEWAGADPAHTAAGGWVLVDRVGRLQLACALLTEARTCPPEDAPDLVNAARRYTWNWLRQPPPEAATEIHVRRTAELVAWIRRAGPVAQRSGA
ncbi:hypothetical protein GCM10010271_19410 [Streptomyces kurssanovii]|nr:hypothetical protein GCM10010271_19410 [Streptomyces kurssanovii]